MSNSLRDQLLQQGLVTKKQVQDADAQKRKQRKQRKRAPDAQGSEAEQARQLAAKRQAEKVARDRELNRQREQERQAKAQQARVRDLIEGNQVPRQQGELSFNFSHGKRIKRLYVNAEQHKQLATGRLGIAVLGRGYYLLPREAAERLREAAPKALVHLYDPSSDEDQAYADHPIPDDLIW